METLTEQPVRYNTALLPDQSPYSLQSNPNVRIAHQGTEFVPITDVILEEDTEKGSKTFGQQIRKKIRFIDAFDSIYEDEQLKRGGYSPNYGRLLSGADRRSRNDIILIEKGIVEVTKSMKPNKVEYLSKCNYNGSNPNRDANIRILFYLDDSAGKAKRDYEATELTDVAVSKLVSLKGNYRKMQEIAKIFNLDTNGTEQQIYLSLKAAAQKEPQKVIDAFVNEKASVDFIASKALELKLVTFTGTSFKYSDSGEKLISFQGRQNEQKAFKALCRKLESNEGVAELAQLTSMIEAQQLLSASAMNS